MTVAARLTAAMVGAEVIGMIGTLAFPTLVPTLAPAWGLSGTEIGWLNGLFQGGYVCFVAILTALTDRMDPRRIYLAAAVVSTLAYAGFALFADGFWSALPWQLLAGVGLAGTYMPGLKLLSDLLAKEVPAGRVGRSMSFYTAGYAVGAAVSVFVVGLAAEAAGPQGAFILASAASATAGLIVLLCVPPAPPSPRPGQRLFNARIVLRNRASMGYVAAYACHMWELFGFRGWLVAFLAFAAVSHGLDPARAAGIAAAIFLLGLPASILGNELATKFGRRRVIAVVMILGALVSGGIGFAATLPFWVVIVLAAVLGVFVLADSSALTVGAISHADPALKGQTIAVHSTLGFFAATCSPIVFGVILDQAGGSDSVTAWGLAFAAMGAGAILGPIVLALIARNSSA